MRKYLKPIIVSAFLFALIFSGSSVRALSVQELQAQINALTAQLAQLQQQLVEQKGGQSPQPVAWCHTFNKDLRVGDGGMDGGNRKANDTDKDVSALKQALYKEGLYDLEIDQPGTAGSSIKNTYFNEQLASAVVGFQEKYTSEILAQYGLKHGTGYVGKSTRAKLNKLYGCNGVSPVAPITPVDPITPPVQPAPLTQPSMSVCPDFNGDGIVNRFDRGLLIDCIYLSKNCAGYNFDLSGDGLYRAIDDAPLFAQFLYKKASDIDACGGASQPTTQPAITVLSPNGGEIWKAGEVRRLRWTSNSDANRVVIDIINSNGLSVDAGLLAVLANQKFINWTIPTTLPAGKYKMKIMICPDSFTDLSCANVDLKQYGYDQSDSQFMITKPAMVNTCTDSDGGKNHNLKGTVIANENIWGGTGPFVDSCITNSNVHNLLEWSCVGTQAISTGYECPNGCSDGACKKATEVQSSITVLIPSGGEVLYYGEYLKIKGKVDSSKKGNVKYWLVDSSKEYKKLLGSYSITPQYNIFEQDSLLEKGSSTYSPYPLGDNYKILAIFESDDGLEKIEDYSSASFSIKDANTSVSSIDLISPNGGEILKKGQIYRVKWNHEGKGDFVRIYIYDDSIFGSGSTNYIVPNNGSVPIEQGYYDWTVGNAGVSGANNNNYRISIGTIYSGLNDKSDGAFTINESTTSCKDADNGVDYYLKGYASGGIGSTQKAEDMCGADGYLYEYYCHVNNNSINYLKYKCPYGCSDGACKKNDTDLEIKSIIKDNSSPYLFSTNVCVVGSKSINDLKTSISGLSNFPWRYDIIDSSGNITKGTGGVVGSIENIKNGACQTFYWTIQPTHQSLFNQSGQVKITLDENNLIKETNEDNNEKLYKGSVACNVSQCWNSDFVMLSCIDDWADNKISQDNLLACQNLNFYTCSQSPALKGDLNGDNHVNGKDYSILEAVWSNNPTFNSTNKKLVCADMNNNGRLDDFDLLDLVDILASCPNKGADGLGDCTASDLGLSNFEKQLASIRESVEAMLKDFLKR